MRGAEGQTRLLRLFQRQQVMRLAGNVARSKFLSFFFLSFTPMCNPPGSAPSHRAGLEPGMPAREAGALPRRLKATATSVSEVYTQPLLAYIRYTCTRRHKLSRRYCTIKQPVSLNSSRTCRDRV